MPLQYQNEYLFPHQFQKIRSALEYPQNPEGIPFIVINVKGFIAKTSDI